MAHTGYTEIRLEQLPPEHTAAPVPAPAPPPQTPVRQTAPAPARPAPAARPNPAPAQDPEPAVENIENIQVISAPPVQYVMVDRPASCAGSPLCVAILVLVSVAVLLLMVILVLLCRGRVPLWPWYYPVWVRRHLRYKQSRRF
jgi:hypothetical protein